MLVQDPAESSRRRDVNVEGRVELQECDLVEKLDIRRSSSFLRNVEDVNNATAGLGAVCWGLSADRLH
ncbi:hypothetical protein M758_3G181300 [Ceratodon purpureus]|nr:hypothetical protein M758_3G181300 [Ceratodon purpureus]